MKLIGTDQLPELSDSGICYYQVTAAGPEPKVVKLTVIQENIRRVGGVRSVNQVVNAAVPQPGFPIGIEEDRGVSVVMMVDHEFSRRRLQQRIRERTRGKVRIEDDQGEARGVKKQNHHQSRSEECASRAGTKESQDADQERGTCDQQRRAEVGE